MVKAFPSPALRPTPCPPPPEGSPPWDLLQELSWKACKREENQGWVDTFGLVIR